MVDSSGAGRDGSIVVGSGSTGGSSAGEDATLDHFWTLERVHGLGRRPAEAASGRG